MSLSSMFSSFFPVVHADAPEDKEVKEEPAQEEAQEEPQEEEEEEEPEDVLPGIQEACEQSAKCAPLLTHFQHCEEKVNAGEGYKGEDCVEEFYHLMHCVNGCVAPKLFSQLK
ncbi:ubiquinol-cytochrome C reductase hinge domain-containing protein [Lenzites betulinus]|nr:ubiquinol-cytochrome C reductase hinge domain-containing protein [Lenzites betulinus]